MTSRGIGDARRILGQPQSWIDQHFPPQHPPLPQARGDQLLSFAIHQVANWENQVTVEAREYRTGTHGAAFIRWATDIRRHCSAVRRVLARYAHARDTESPELPCLRETIRDLVTSWDRHPDWRENWD